MIPKSRAQFFSTNCKMNHNQTTNRIPKIEASNQRVRQLNSYDQRPSSIQQKIVNNEKKKAVTIDEVPLPQFLESSNDQSQPRFDEEKLPLFLIKLWNIVEDPNIQTIVHWDESGISFHIADPYSFCRNVLPHYFKHNNLNSLIRQLNMYGFRKMTPLNQGGLTRTESDQDHLEFSHPYFVQNHPELLINIKRKQSARITEDKQVSVQTQHNVEMVMKEVRSMREQIRNMENRMNTVTKENRQLWDQMTTMRQQHTRQQHVVQKLFQFLVSIVQPSLAKRVTKRGVLAIDDFGINGPSNAKRPKNDSTSGQGSQSTTGGSLLNTGNLYEMLESLQRELRDGVATRRFSNDRGPVIADVTDELGHSPNGSSRHNSFSAGDISNPENIRNSYDVEHTEDASPVPIVSPASSGSMKIKPTTRNSFDYPSPNAPYMGSGALSMENVMPKTIKNHTTNEDYNINRKQPKRSSYKGQYSPNTSVTTYQPTGTVIPQYQNQLTYNNYNDGASNEESQKQLAQCLPRREEIGDLQQGNLNSMSFPEERDIMTPTLIMSPSMERQLSQEMQEYLNTVDFSIDNCRDLLNTTDWDSFGDIDLHEYGEGTSEQLLEGENGRQQLALEHAPIENYGNFEENQNSQKNGFQEIPAVAINDQHLQDSNDNLDFDAFDVNFTPMQEPANRELYPKTPELLTPGSSPSRA